MLLEFHESLYAQKSVLLDRGISACQRTQSIHHLHTAYHLLYDIEPLYNVVQTVFTGFCPENDSVKQDRTRVGWKPIPASSRPVTL